MCIRDSVLTATVTKTARILSQIAARAREVRQFNADIVTGPGGCLSPDVALSPGCYGRTSKRVSFEGLGAGDTLVRRARVM